MTRLTSHVVQLIPLDHNQFTSAHRFRSIVSLFWSRSRFQILVDIPTFTNGMERIHAVGSGQNYSKLG